MPQSQQKYCREAVVQGRIQRRRQLKRVRCAQVDSVISQLYPDSWLSTQSGTWSRYQIATTVRRENETASSSIYAAAHPGTAQACKLCLTVGVRTEEWACVHGAVLHSLWNPAAAPFSRKQALCLCWVCTHLSHAYAHHDFRALACCSP